MDRPAEPHLTLLPDRAVIEVAGPDRVGFLQGLVSNDVALAALGRAVWAALLTPQGKWLADFFILADGDTLLLDCERAQAPMLAQRLTRFRLRSKIEVRGRDDLHVAAAWGAAPAPAPGALPAPDPRLPEAGWRILSAQAMAANATADAWDDHRLSLGLPDGSRDLDGDKTVLLEAGFDELHGGSWTKGCYLGQELTARTKYRGLLKRRLAPVGIDGPAPARDAPVLLDGREVGAMRSSRGAAGLAVLRLEALAAARPLSCGQAVLHARIPGWMILPAAAA